MQLRGRCPARYQLVEGLTNYLTKSAKMVQHLTMSNRTSIRASVAAGVAAGAVTRNPVIGLFAGLWDHAIQTSAADAVALAVEAEVRRREQELSRSE